MITFTKLGEIGRLGNQLFQIAGTIGIAIRNDQSFVFPVWAYSEYYKNPIPQVEKEYLLNLELRLATTPFHYQPVSLAERCDWDIRGYFQSEKYFKHCENTIRDYFTLKESHISYLRSKYRHLLEADCCSISVRRGDYLQFQDYHPVLPLDYFKRGMAQFPADTIYLVFSDDIDWCKRQFVGDKFFFIEEPSVVLSLHLMSFCRNHIIPNSTLGWWGAWLNVNSDKKVIAPVRWFGEGYADLNTKDLIPEEWLKIQGLQQGRTIMESKNQADDLNRLFSYKVCINLDRRPERWRRMEERFAQHGISSVIRMTAIDGRSVKPPATWPYSSGHYGCLQSHLAILRQAQENELPLILIFEDDCIFDPDFNRKFVSHMKQVPEDWDMLLFGGVHYEEPIKISENVVRAKMTYLTHAYALKRRIYDVLIELCEGGQGAIDDHTVTLQKDFNCYCFAPDLIWQERLDSDTRDR